MVPLKKPIKTSSTRTSNLISEKALSIEIIKIMKGIKLREPQTSGAIFMPWLVLNSSISPFLNHNAHNFPQPILREQKPATNKSQNNPEDHCNVAQNYAYFRIFL